ncbi:MAG: RES family NAD+ phosphorylase [Bryobacteraceae bacterium]
MRACRLCRALYPAYDGEGARRAGGRWNSKGTRILYMSENRSLSVLEALVHLTDTLPDKFVLGSAEIPDEVFCDSVHERNLPSDWQTLVVRRQDATRSIGDEWIKSVRSAVLLVPSVVSGERNVLLNPEHPDFRRIRFFDAEPFKFDLRLLFRPIIAAPTV